MSKKYYVALDDYERGTIINCLNEKRNKLIADSKLSTSKKPYKVNCNAVRHETKRLPSFTKNSMRTMFRAR